MTKKGIKALFLESLMKEYKWNFLMTFEVGQGVSRINPQGFHASVCDRG